LFDDALQKLVRQGGENAGAVACVRFAPASATVIHVAEHFFGIDQNLVAAFPFDVRNETDTARIMFERGVIKALLGREAE
jgi:hypothetical protein